MRTVTFDLKTLEGLRGQPGTDEGKVFNLVRGLQKEIAAAANESFLPERGRSITGAGKKRLLKADVVGEARDHASLDGEEPDSHPVLGFDRRDGHRDRARLILLTAHLGRQRARRAELRCRAGGREKSDRVNPQCCVLPKSKKRLWIGT